MMRAGPAGSTMALPHFYAALTAEPDNAEANSVYGLMLLHLRLCTSSPALQRMSLSSGGSGTGSVN